MGADGGRWSLRAWMRCSGALLIAGCVAFYLLLQSRSLWAGPVPLPGGESGFFGAIRALFPVAWLDATRGSEIGLRNVALYLAILIWLFALYWLVARRAWRHGAAATATEPNALALVMGVAVLCLFVLFWVPGTFSSDLYSYAWYSRILGAFGDNPFIAVPLDYASRDTGGWLDYVYWKDVPSAYGPLWVLLAGGIGWIGQAIGAEADLGWHILAHKLLGSATHILNIVLIWRVSALFFTRYGAPRQAMTAAAVETLGAFPAAPGAQSGAQLAATLTYAWCPLLFVEVGANGHNDVMLLSGVLVALLLYLNGHWRAAAIALALASLIKVAALALLPGYLWLLFWQGCAAGRSNYGLLRVAHALGVAAATWAVFYLPFWQGVGTLNAVFGGPAARLFTNSLAGMLHYKGVEWLQALAAAQGWQPLASMTFADIQDKLATPLRLAAAGITLGFAFVATWRARTFASMVICWGWVLFVSLTIGAIWFWPWYVIWLLPMAALAGPGHLFSAAQILCVGSLVLYALYPLMAHPFTELPYYRALITIAPALLFLLAAYGWPRFKG